MKKLYEKPKRQATGKERKRKINNENKKDSVHEIQVKARKRHPKFTNKESKESKTGE